MCNPTNTLVLWAHTSLPPPWHLDQFSHSVEGLTYVMNTQAMLSQYTCMNCLHLTRLAVLVIWAKKFTLVFYCIQNNTDTEHKINKLRLHCSPHFNKTVHNIKTLLSISVLRLVAVYINKCCSSDSVPLFTAYIICKKKVQET